MSDYIKRDDALTSVNEFYHDPKVDIALRAVPAADVVAREEHDRVCGELEQARELCQKKDDKIKQLQADLVAAQATAIVLQHSIPEKEAKPTPQAGERGAVWIRQTEDRWTPQGIASVEVTRCSVCGYHPKHNHTEFLSFCPQCHSFVDKDS